MTDDKVIAVLNAISDKIPENKMYIFKQKLQAADDDKAEAILCEKIYNPTHILLFSIFLGGFGVDRFLIGDIGLGVAKLLLGWFACGIWPLIDIFLSYKRAKEKNFDKIMLNL